MMYILSFTFSQARLQGPRCELVEEEGPRGANEHSGEQAVQDVQRLRLRLLQRQRTAHRGQQVQGISTLISSLVVAEVVINKPSMFVSRYSATESRYG